MYDISANYAEYDEVLAQHSTGQSFLLGGFIFLTIVGFFIFFLWCYLIKEDVKDCELSKKQKKQTAVVFTVLFLCSLGLINCIVTTVQSIRNISYDRENQAYEVIDGEFTVTCWNGYRMAKK